MPSQKSWHRSSNEIHANPRSTRRLVSCDSRTEQRERLRNYEVVCVSRGCSICLLQVVKLDAICRELEIHALAKEVKLRYDKRKGILGYRQMRTQLNRKLKKTYNKKRYYRIMRALDSKQSSARSDHVT